MPKQTKCYRLEAHQVAAVQQLAKDNGESSESAAIRFIIDDWVRLNSKPAAQPECDTCDRREACYDKPLRGPWCPAPERQQQQEPTK